MKKTGWKRIFAIALCCVFGALAACGEPAAEADVPDVPKPEEPSIPTLKRYDAVFKAEFGDFKGELDLLAGAYLATEGESTVLTVIFKPAELENGAVAFVDDVPNSTEMTNGVRNGTIGCYRTDGSLITRGVALTYSSGDDHVAGADGKHVYYVRSAAFSVDGVRAEYLLTLYINSSEEGIQLVRGEAAVSLDLATGRDVAAVEGEGSLERGEAPQPTPTYEYTQYDGALDCYLDAMGGVNFGRGLLAGVYVRKDETGSFLTLVFEKIERTLYHITAEIFPDDAPENAGDDRGVKDGTFGLYRANGSLAAAVSFTYDVRDLAVGPEGKRVAFVKTATFPLDGLRTEYRLALYLNSSVMGVQFCENSAAARKPTYSAKLTLDLKSGRGAETPAFGSATK